MAVELTAVKGKAKDRKQTLARIVLLSAEREKEAKEEGREARDELNLLMEEKEIIVTDIGIVQKLFGNTLFKYFGTGRNGGEAIYKDICERIKSLFNIGRGYVEIQAYKEDGRPDGDPFIQEINSRLGEYGQGASYLKATPGSVATVNEKKAR